MSHNVPHIIKFAVGFLEQVHHIVELLALQNTQGSDEHANQRSLDRAFAKILLLAFIKREDDEGQDQSERLYTSH